MKPLKPHIAIEGIGKSVAVVRIPRGSTKQERDIAIAANESLAKAHSTKSKVYSRDWKNYWQKKGKR